MSPIAQVLIGSLPTLRSTALNMLTGTLQLSDSTTPRRLRISDLVRPHWKALTVAVLGETLTDADWRGRRRSRLSGEQIRDAFRAGGYTREEVELYTRSMRKRIAELSAL